MRGATGLIFKRHQILHLPRKMTLMIDVRHIWNLSYNARSNRTHPPTSPILRLPRKMIHVCDLSYCARSLFLQRHQILRLLRKMTRVIDACHIWNIIYNAWSNRHHPPTSPNTAPATQNCTPKSKRNLRKPVKRHLQWRTFENDPNMIRAWNCKTESPVRRAYFSPSATHFVLKITTFRAPAIYPNFTRYCACHEKWHSTITKYCTCHAKWLSWWMSVTYETSVTISGATSLIRQRHQILHLPRKIALQHRPEINPKGLTMIRTWSEHELVISHPPVRRS